MPVRNYWNISKQIEKKDRRREDTIGKVWCDQVCIWPAGLVRAH
jgi:hypothetical protein